MYSQFTPPYFANKLPVYLQNTGIMGQIKETDKLVDIYGNYLKLIFGPKYSHYGVLIFSLFIIILILFKWW